MTKKNPLRTSCNLLSLDGWGKAQASAVCTDLGAQLEGLWESPPVYHIFPLWLLLIIPVCPTHSPNPFLFHSFPTICTLLRDHSNTQLKETPRDTHDSREPSSIFLKYMTLDIRFCFSSPFAIPSLKCIPICAFSSAHQACKLLFQAKKSLKEVTPQRTGCAVPKRVTLRRISTGDEIFPYSFPPFLALKLICGLGEVGNACIGKRKDQGFLFPTFAYLSQNSSAYFEGLTEWFLLWKLPAIFSIWDSLLHTHRGTQLWMTFFLP